MKTYKSVGRLKDYQAAIFWNRKGAMSSVASFHRHDDFGVCQCLKQVIQAVRFNIDNYKSMRY